jgi:hypothetical protein
MAAKSSSGAITAADVDAKLPRRFFVMRGDLQSAFGLSKEEIAALINDGTFVAKYPLGKAGKRARFVRSQVLAVARKWELAD